MADIIMKAGTVVWNGPVGVFEFDQFGEGTKTVAMAIANTKPLPWRAAATPSLPSKSTTSMTSVLHLHCRRRVPGIPGRQGTARRRDSGAAGQRLIFEY